MADLLDFPDVRSRGSRKEKPEWDPWKSPVAGPVTRVRELFPEAPADWLNLPAEIVVAFFLFPGQGVNQALFNEYHVTNIEEAICVSAVGGGRVPLQGGINVSSPSAE